MPAPCRRLAALRSHLPADGRRSQSASIAAAVSAVPPSSPDDDRSIDAGDEDRSARAGGARSTTEAVEAVGEALSAAELAHFREEGWVVLRNAAPLEDVEQIRRHMYEAMGADEADASTWCTSTSDPPLACDFEAFLWRDCL